MSLDNPVKNKLKKNIKHDFNKIKIKKHKLKNKTWKKKREEYDSQ